LFGETHRGFVEQRVEEGDSVGEKFPAGVQFGGHADACFVEDIHLPFGVGDESPRLLGGGADQTFGVRS
jgi:hypothetical protein